MPFRSFFLITVCLILLTNPHLATADANVFVYHRFGDPRYPSTNTSLDDFESHLRILKEEGYAVMSLGEIVSLLQKGGGLPSKCAAITIDDGYDSFLSGAIPLLNRFGYRATLFVSTGTVGRPGYLGWDDLRRLAIAGVEIGNHSHAHPYYHTGGEEPGKGWHDKVTEDILKAQKIFQKELGFSPSLFAYPFGEYSPELVNIVMDAGFVGAALQVSGVISEQTGSYELPRFPMGGPFGNPADFRKKLHMKALPVEVISPVSTILSGENPPTLRVRITSHDANLERLKFYIDGREGGIIVQDEDDPSIFIVRAPEPFKGRRSRYTLTAPGLSEGSWFWFSRLWLNPKEKF